MFNKRKPLIKRFIRKKLHEIIIFKDKFWKAEVLSNESRFVSKSEIHITRTIINRVLPKIWKIRRHTIRVVGISKKGKVRMGKGTGKVFTDCYYIYKGQLLWTINIPTTSSDLLFIRYTLYIIRNLLRKKLSLPCTIRFYQA